MKFIKEIWGRLGMKSPSFFVIVQKLSIVVTALSGLPVLLQQFASQTGVQVPKFMTDFSNKTFFFCGIVAFVISKLPVKDPDATKINNAGDVVQKLPFTKKN